MHSSDLRKKYIEFFKRNHHQVVPSASLTPSKEEQLEGKEEVLFTSAGMQPLIPYLTGQKEPPSRRLVDVQKCLRTDDIREVGDSTHHTFFEMLGNWSIGSYWKEEAIKLSFEFLTKELQIPLERLFISVFSGDDDAPRDEESAQIWKELGVPEEKIIFLGKEHNWWPTARKEQDSGEYQNPSGPCGPDTEMFYWTGDGNPEGNPKTNSLWVEIWNDVFMQYNRKESGALEDLPQRNVDTGMGLERTLAVLNGKKNAYETDLFEPVISLLREGSGNNYNEIDTRVIADHMRAGIFLISEGIEPSNKGHGYVLRRLLRRSEAKSAYSLHIDIPFTDILDHYAEVYRDIYPEIFDNKDSINRVLEKEFAGFVSILEKAFKEFNKIKTKNPKIIPGKDIFYLHTTHGLTIEIIKDIAESEGVELDEEGFQEEFKKHQELSRSSSKF